MASYDLQKSDSFQFDFADGNGTLKIFPVEIWEAILDQVEDSEDLIRFGKAFPFWDDVLHKTKQAWLFDQIFPHVWSYLSKTEILSCRRVCRRWTSSVDRFLENNEYHRPADLSGSYLRRRPLIRGLRDIGLLYSPYTASRMEKLCLSAQSHPKNPIIGRSVYVDWERVPSTYTPFLSQFGSHIWYFRAHCTHRDIHPELFLLRILDYLPFLPNLRKLELFLWEGHQSRALPGVPQQVDHVTSALRSYSLSKLETLELEIMGHLHGTVKDLLVNAFSSRLRRLSVNRFALSPPFPNLTDLSITIDSNHQMECLIQLEAPVTRLSLSIVNYANYPMAFKALQHFSPTLKAVAVEFPASTSFNPLDWKHLKSQSLDLPHMKTLALKGCIPPSLNFITGLTSLQYLHIYDLRSTELIALLDTQTVFYEEIVEILCYLNQPSQFRKKGAMYQSNLWEVFPRLREFTCTSFTRRTPGVERTYRRDYYEKYQQLSKSGVNLVVYN